MKLNTKLFLLIISNSKYKYIILLQEEIEQIYVILEQKINKIKLLKL